LAFDLCFVFILLRIASHDEQQLRQTFLLSSIFKYPLIADQSKQTFLLTD